MQCANHPDIVAVDRCAGCAETFCQDCLVTIQGRNFCSACKVMHAQQAASYAAVEEATIPCEEAGAALKYALIGLVCFGIILEPMAIAKALAAKKKIAQNPQLAGAGKANAALAIGIIVLIFWVLGLIARASNV